MTRINVRVVVNARRARVIEEPDGLKLYVTAPAESGRANEAVILLLADFLGVRPRNLRIVHGERSRKKVVELDLMR